MKRHRLVTIILIFLSSNITYSQVNISNEKKYSIGTNSGINILMMKGGFENYNLQGTKTQPGYFLGLNMQRKFGQNFNIKFEINLRQYKGSIDSYFYSYERTNDLGEKIVIEEYRGSVIINYTELSIPIIIELEPFDGNGLIFQLGGGINPIPGKFNKKSMATYELTSYYREVNFNEYEELSSPKIGNYGRRLSYGRGNNIRGRVIIGIGYKFDIPIIGGTSLLLRYQRRGDHTDMRLFGGKNENGSFEIMINFSELIKF